MMDDNRIEDLLRKSWQPEPPEGMRGRVLERAGSELHRRRFRLMWPVLPRWQVGLAAASLLVVLVCGISNSARESRLAALENSETPPARVLVAQRPLTLDEGRLQVYRMLRDPSSDLLVP